MTKQAPFLPVNAAEQSIYNDAYDYALAGDGFGGRTTEQMELDWPHVCRGKGLDNRVASISLVAYAQATASQPEGEHRDRMQTTVNTLRAQYLTYTTGLRYAVATGNADSILLTRVEAYWERTHNAGIKLSTIALAAYQDTIAELPDGAQRERTEEALAQLNALRSARFVQSQKRLRRLEWLGAAVTVVGVLGGVAIWRTVVAIPEIAHTAAPPPDRGFTPDFIAIGIWPCISAPLLGPSLIVHSRLKSREERQIFYESPWLRKFEDASSLHTSPEKT